MRVWGRLEERDGGTHVVNRSDFAYEVGWHVESDGSGQPVVVDVGQLRVIEAREDGNNQVAEWNPTFVAGTIGSLNSFAPGELLVGDGQSVSLARSLALGPAANDFLILRAGGFENDLPNLPDMLPAGEIAIRPFENGFGLSLAVDGGEFAYETNWRVELI